MNSYDPKRYWMRLADEFRCADDQGFAPVLHPLAPPWFNRLIDKLQFRAFRRALTAAALDPGARVLDVGCGTGRWVRRLRGMGFRPVGIDATLGMLEVARSHTGEEQVTAAAAQQLPFSNESFDCVSDVTVLQHIPSNGQHQALTEMTRVLKPGGCLILFELIRGKDSHIFPRDPDGWIREAESCGVTLTTWFAQEFLVFDALFTRIVQAGRSNRIASPDDFARREARASARSLAARRVYWQLRHITATLSSWVEPLSARVCPARFATHGVFVFRK